MVLARRSSRTAARAFPQSRPRAAFRVILRFNPQTPLETPGLAVLAGEQYVVEGLAGTHKLGYARGVEGAYE